MQYAIFHIGNDEKYNFTLLLYKLYKFPVRSESKVITECYWVHVSAWYTKHEKGLRHLYICFKMLLVHYSGQNKQKCRKQKKRQTRNSLVLVMPRCENYYHNYYYMLLNRYTLAKGLMEYGHIHTQSWDIKRGLEDIRHAFPLRKTYKALTILSLWMMLCHECLWFT